MLVHKYIPNDDKKNGEKKSRFKKEEDMWVCCLYEGKSLCKKDNMTTS